MCALFDKKRKVKGYIIGVSSGMFGAAGREEQVSYIDISQKAFYSALKGVNFTMIDIERSTEFISPEIEKRVKKLKEELGIEIGFHGLSRAMEARGIFLDSAIEDDYLRTHEALIRDLERSGKLGGRFYLQHASETTPYGWLGKDLQPTAIVDIWGRRLNIFLEEHPDILNWLINQPEITECFRVPTRKEMAERYKADPMIRYRLEDIVIREKGIPPEKIKERWAEIEKEIDKKAEELAEKNVKKEIIEEIKKTTMAYGPERIAYLVTAKWMSDNNDPIWQGIVGKKFEEVRGNPRVWVPAVSAKYIWGHFNPKKLADPKPILEKYDIYFVIETAMVSAGIEEEYRFVHPKHFVVLCKHSGTRYFKACIDFEHILGAGINPDEEIDAMEPDGGKYVNVLHVGWPTPLQPAHYPIPLGSEQQEWLYRWMYKLRKKGFDESEDRFIIFERAAPIGQLDPVLQSTLALRKIIKYLRLDVPPDKLPLDFYGIEEKDLKMQETQIKEHALDPIRGLLKIPEEKFSFLGRAAAAEGKGREWETEKYR